MTDANIPMKAIIFAGGIGSRMWPLSRKSSPKQFEPIIEGKSTLQLTIDRIRPEFGWQDIYISTGAQYVDIIKRQIPDIPHQNIIGEPEMRDVAPAVGYVMSIIARNHPNVPTAILWSDHLLQRVDAFKKALFAGAKLLKHDADRFIFLGQRPRFANQNLGWIELGQVTETVDDFEVRRFKSWHYRPELKDAKEYYLSGKYAWNPGYFVVTPKFVLSQYQQHAPKMYEQLQTLMSSYGTPAHQKDLDRLYPSMEKISFDDAVVVKTKPEQAVVISVEFGWADLGTWEAVKEAFLTQNTENLTQGNVHTLDSTDSLIYAYTDQLVAGIDLEHMVVVVTKDAILVSPQHSIPKIKTLLNQFEGTDLEKYT